MAREASPSAKRSKQEAVRRREQAVIAAHCKKVGIPVPEEKREYETVDGKRKIVGYMEMDGGKQEQNYMRNLLTTAGAEIVPIPADGKFKILWDEKKLADRQKDIWNRHSKARKKVESDGGPMKQESADVTHAMLDDIDKYLLSA